MAGEMSQSVKHWLCKHENPNLTPKTHIKKSSMVVCACKTSASEAEKGETLGLTDQSPTSARDGVSKRETKQKQGTIPFLTFGLLIHMHTCALTPVYTNICRHTQ